jgi:hypothetical protein
MLILFVVIGLCLYFLLGIGFHTLACEFDRSNMAINVFVWPIGLIVVAFSGIQKK